MMSAILRALHREDPQAKLACHACIEVPSNHLIRDDVAYFASLGFENISSFACFLGEEYEALHGEPDLSAFM